MCYILITPVRNEEKHLPVLAECIISQLCRPILWIIVDDNSTDQTSIIIQNLMDKYDWIGVKTRTQSDEYGPLSFAKTLVDGYNYAKEICNKRNLVYNYVGKIDADIIIQSNYFKQLLNEIKLDSDLAIIAGQYYSLKTIHEIKNKSGEKHCHKEIIKRSYFFDEIADERLYRKDFLEKVGGFPITYSPDTVLLVKARLNGWKFKVCNDVHFQEVRKGDQEGMWNRNKKMGYGRYYLDYHPLLILLSTFHLVAKKQYSNAVAYCFGYCLGMLKRDNKINDLEIRNYFRNTRLHEFYEKIKDMQNKDGGLFKFISNVFT